MKKTLPIFCCYAREDHLFLLQLKKHLKPLEHNKIIIIQADIDISPGEEWKQKINQYLNNAQIILLLVSPDFIGSDYCYSIEMKRAMERHESGEARIVPVILCPVDWQGTPFGKLRALPTNTKPVTMWRDRNKAFLNIVEGIHMVIEQLSTETERSTSVLPDIIFPQPVMPIGLPRPPSFIGREEYLGRLRLRLLAGETTGICALNGMGGIGKTALAAEIVAQLSQDRKAFPGGALWVPCEGLVGLEGLNEIWKQIADSIQLKVVKSHGDLSKALARKLAQFPYLLIALDNIEPQLDVDILLDTLAIPGHTALLLTARQALAPERLTSFILPPLSINDAAMLFIQRLRQRDDSRPTSEDENSIPKIVAALGNLPLAIELVAAYAGIQSLPLVHILWELEQDKVEANSLNSDPRRALISRFNRSWAVLSLEEQQLFAGLSLLGGRNFSREAAIALTRRPLEAQERDLKKADRSSMRQSEQRIAKLIAYALVESLRTMRLRLHPLLHEYAAMRLRESGQEEYLKHALNDFWLRRSQNSLKYEGLSGIEANSAWNAQNEKWTKEVKDQTTSAFLPTVDGYSMQLERLGLHLFEDGEVELGNARILESSRFGKSLEELEKLRKTAKSRNKTRRVIWVSHGTEKQLGIMRELSDKPLRIGRSDDSDIVLEQTFVSRTHATILPLGNGRFGIRDEKSTSGTWVKSQNRYIDNYLVYELHIGDIIQIGKVILNFDTYEHYFASPE